MKYVHITKRCNNINTAISPSQADFSFTLIVFQVAGGNFAWDPESKDPILSDVNIDVPKGAICIITLGCENAKNIVQQTLLN